MDTCFPRYPTLVKCMVCAADCLPYFSNKITEQNPARTFTSSFYLLLPVKHTQARSTFGQKEADRKAALFIPNMFYIVNIILAAQDRVLTFANSL